jgi:7-keto-8-aminopelargonate synthetase-like enzyme
MTARFQETFQRELEAELRKLEAQDQRRALEEIRVVNLCSNDYLELSANAALKEAVPGAVRETPRIGGTGSRLRFPLTCGIANDELVRLENCLNSRREQKCRPAAAGRP